MNTHLSKSLKLSDISEGTYSSKTQVQVNYTDSVFTCVYELYTVNQLIIGLENYLKQHFFFFFFLLFFIQIAL